ncbi:D-lactate dehydrogenase [Natranaerovirga pectinivora]|uniref:D-lactate dehydrogenase n=1 Tax=Natranaerovirga pectinivora TaxID=682400 RepID=A0A4V2V0H2_9FIRM|nr:D-isomer specific 2-hydroxyacid dehydrogenase family protein [Natranaerovirga pectinivora]TCT16107.1 D-lactate dehydrogenase [Natranaerovirga pectinivora]
MKIVVYSYRPDEEENFNRFSKKYGSELILCKEPPSLDNAHLAKGCECISIVTTKVDEALLNKFKEIGVKFISTRTIGYDHIDIISAEKLGIEVGNITYSPSSVSEYTIMLILMSIRKVNNIIERSNIQDFTIKGLKGRELHNLRVGVIGAGRIGEQVIRNLSGFGCEILVYDHNENGDIKKYAEYVSLDTLYKESDIITLHIPANEDNHHMINKRSISSMKDGVIIINTSRGTLVKTSDLIDGIEGKKVGGAALDVIENEAPIFFKDKKCEVINHREYALLKSYPNVILTPHTAFYTDQAVSDMVENSIKSCVEYMKKI